MMKAMLLAFAMLQDPPPLPPKDEPKDDPKDELAELKKDLTATWTKVIDLCREEKKDDLQKLIVAMELTREEMAALFGEEKAARVYADYKHTWDKVVLLEAAADLVSRFKRNSWNEVEVVCLNEAEDKDLTSDDRGVMAVLQNKETMRVFNVRLKQKDKTTGGLLLKCLTKTKGGWRMGLRIGKSLAEK